MNKISNFHQFVYPAFCSFLLRLQRKRSLNPCGTLMLYKLFQHEWSQPQEWCVQMLPEQRRQAWKKKPFAVTIQACDGLQHLFSKYHPSPADVQHRAMLPPLQRSIWFPLPVTAADKPFSFSLLNKVKNYFALSVRITLGRQRISALAKGTSPLPCVMATAPVRAAMSLGGQQDTCPISSDGQRCPGAQWGMLCALWAPGVAQLAGSHKQPRPLPKEQGVILRRLAKSRGTIILNSYNNPAIPEPTTRTASRKGETRKSGN